MTKYAKRNNCVTFLCCADYKNKENKEFSMLKQSISLVLLCFAGQIFAADIIVNTTEDVTVADDKCSLREAIEYINQGRPEAGYNGCGGKESNNTIYLESLTYNLNKEILISKDVTFRTRYESDLNSNLLGKQNAVIKMNGTDRIFNIDRKSETTETKDDDNAPIQVNFHEITLKGCDALLCKEQGGLIYNKEVLNLNNSQLLNGKAKLGGAIYSAGKFDVLKTAGFVTLNNSLIQGNKAEKGAAIWSETPQYLVKNSVVRDNEVTTASAALFDSLEGFDKDSIANVKNDLRGIVSSTIFNNKGHTIRVMDKMSVSNITMIFNTKGLIIDAPLELGFVGNSILAKNGTEDCTILKGGIANNLSNNLYSNGCVGTLSESLGSTNLIASSSPEGICDISSNAILCPFKEYSDSSLGYFRPRLLETYGSLNDSPIVNKGPTTGLAIIACESYDQRSVARNNVRDLCDRGAVELKVDRNSIQLVGADILYGDVAKMSIRDQLVDGELITPGQCQKLFGNKPSGGTWQPGCLEIIQSPHVPSKGKLTLTQDGDISYQPGSDFHGSDQFKISVITTTTYFSDSLNKRIEIQTNVVQDPPDTFQDYSVKTSGGSFGFVGLMMLLGLTGLRRQTK